MEKFNTILGFVVALGGLAAVGAAAPAHAAGCLQELSYIEAEARDDHDWIRRETVLAMLIEARREATRGHEAACMSVVDRARARLRKQSDMPAPS